jgi:hypothetical protein
MGLISEVEQELTALLYAEMFGREMVIDGYPVTGIWQDDDAAQPGAFAGQIVERYRLVVEKTALTAIVGQEIVVDSKTYTVVASRPMELLTDISVERYTA